MNSYTALRSDPVIGLTRLRALQVGQTMIAITTGVSAAEQRSLDPPSTAWTGVWTHPRHDAKNMRQPVDRDHDNVLLDAPDHGFLLRSDHQNSPPLDRA